MPIPGPLHSRIAPLCTTQEWRDWSGYLCPATYQPSHEVEYFAVRNAAGLIDVSPLYKYELRGPDAGRLADRLLTRDVSKCRVGQVLYSPWCDEDGYVIDDGTLARLGSDHYRLTAADPSLRWLQDVGYGMDVEIEDVSTRLAALALQGPNSRAILESLFSNLSLGQLGYYRLLQTKFKDAPLTVTRTGYTGDLGYELWLPPEHAPALWDRLMDAGRGYGLLPVGLAALDMLRVEAGLLLIEVDYTSSNHAHIPAQKSTPYELGLGWTVAANKADFIGRHSLQALAQPAQQLVGLAVSWPDLEREFGKVGLPPQVAGRASRTPVPLYAGGRHVGQATSLMFSPILKTYIALATLDSQYAQPGSDVEIEITVEYVRGRAGAKVVKPPFYDPPHKKAVQRG
ncbi:MAG: aminomethyltransferase family protein [Anaerolineales bacterium]|nr:aminomethyltransferase family protein [Anaerolineales bacterium]